MELKRLRKTKPCNSGECVHRYVELGTGGYICSNCYEALKEFIKKTERERERERVNLDTRFTYSLSFLVKKLSLLPFNTERR